MVSVLFLVLWSCAPQPVTTTIEIDTDQTFKSAVQLFDQGQLSHADSLFQIVCTVDPYTDEAWWYRYQVAISKEQYDDAHTYIYNAIRYSVPKPHYLDAFEKMDKVNYTPPEYAVGGQGPISVSYDTPPEPIDGYATIQRNVLYPEIAREAGIEGTVIVQVYVSETGDVTKTQIIKGIPKTGLDEAARYAIKRTKFTPALSNDAPLGVWISIPVVFRLKSK